MAKHSTIEWTHHTFNPWWGCSKVSPACKHCYADVFSRRVGHGVRLPMIWGPRSERRFFGDEHWRQPERWNVEAKRKRTRARVFCASMADAFEARPDLIEPRRRLCKLIEQTPHLDWLLLTKRPETASDLAVEAGWVGEWPSNVWAGTTVENQKLANERLPALANIPAQTRFLSCEPLLGSIDVGRWLASIDWVIAGGESGGGSRPMRVEWARGLRDQCVRASIPFHFKQWGAWAPSRSGELIRMTKKKAGRKLDGRTWDEFPVSPCQATEAAAE